MRIKAQRIHMLSPETEGEEVLEMGSFPTGKEGEGPVPQKGESVDLFAGSRDRAHSREHGFQSEISSRATEADNTSGEATSTRQLEAIRNLDSNFEPLEKWPQSKRNGVRIFHANTIKRKCQGIQYSSPDELPKDAVIEFKNTSGPFHMQNCYFPIDIIFVDQNMLVTGISRMNPGDKLLYPPNGSAHAYETHVGWAKSNGIKLGQKLF